MNREKKIKGFNEVFFENLSEILKKINKRMHFKMYSIIYSEDKEIENIIRLKKTVSKGNDNLCISQDNLQKIDDVFDELKLDFISKDNSYEKIKENLNSLWKKNRNSSEMRSSEILERGISYKKEEEDHNRDALTENVLEKRILYTNELKFNSQKYNFSIVYIIEIRNIDYFLYESFYNIPETSFLRMLLDYYFIDYFSLDKIDINLNDKETILKKYNENPLHFNRRILRLFFGKMQNFLLENTKLTEFGKSFDNELNSQYYINSLLEKIDDISTLTYETANPFGSILFVNKEKIIETSMINFTIKFMEEDRILLEDAKRIRKLLETTNISKDLYLISDGIQVYGLGRVNWNSQKDTLILRLDFSGLSKYNLILMRTIVKDMSNGKVFNENGQKIYRSDLHILELHLVSISFKNPSLGEEGYSEEKFTNLLNSVFWGEQIEKQENIEKIERLNQIVLKARDQKHGTMVVITDSLTANKELKQLSKQSTLIDPQQIDPEHINFLTAIDGAIYFDIDGNCYAIGVILDGIANQEFGDSSRGARYNSAYRYLYKLKDNEQKKCVIIIISEDGTVDLIPELELEDQLLATAEELIDMINEKDTDLVKQKEKEDLLLDSKNVDYDWLFNIAKTFEENKNYEKAISFYNAGFKKAEKSYVNDTYYNSLGHCYFQAEKFEDALEACKHAVNQSKNAVYMYNIALTYYNLSTTIKDKQKESNFLLDSLNWFSQTLENINDHKQYSHITSQTYYYRAYCYFKLSELEIKNKEENSNTLLKNSNDNINRAIEIVNERSDFYILSAKIKNRRGQMKGYIEDLIKSIIFSSKITLVNKLIDELTEVLEKNLHLAVEIYEFYKRSIDDDKDNTKLKEILSRYSEKEKKNELLKKTTEQIDQ